MLVIVLLMLAVLAFIICRILSVAYRRAEKKQITTVEQQMIDDVSINTNLDAKSTITIFTDIHDEKALDESTTFEVLTPDPHAPDLGNVDLPYADPVDGMPFEPDESVVPCLCGLAYREDSVRWLAEYQKGCCIHCGAAVSLP